MRRGSRGSCLTLFYHLASSNTAMTFMMHCRPGRRPLPRRRPGPPMPRSACHRLSPSASSWQSQVRGRGRHLLQHGLGHSCQCGSAHGTAGWGSQLPLCSTMPPALPGTALQPGSPARWRWAVLGAIAVRSTRCNAQCARLRFQQHVGHRQAGHCRPGAGPGRSDANASAAPPLRQPHNAPDACQLGFAGCRGGGNQQFSARWGVPLKSEGGQPAAVAPALDCLLCRSLQSAQR